MSYRDKITEIFCCVDDFCKEFSSEIVQAKRRQLPGDKKYRNRTGQLSDSEVITIMIGFHLGSHRTFKHYYNQVICNYLRDMFPGAVSYSRFVRLQQRAFVVFALFLKSRLGKCTGISFIDSTTIKVCRNQRIHNHKTFNGLAERGHSSMGWFYGFKLHLVCNERGELLSFYLTKGNVDDRNPKHIKVMCENLFGKMFGDKGYISQALWQMLFADGIQLFTKLKKKMKGHIMSLSDKIRLRKRAIIESVNDELKNMCQIEQTRHRSVNNFIMNILGALTAYCFFPKKPSLNIRKTDKQQLLLGSA
jgi:hypothetical protein